jgi:hypothetical protein
MWGWIILGSFVTLFVGALAWRLTVGRRKPGYLALAEYWVYVRQPQLPSTEAIMTRMISDNPHNRVGKPCISNREGMLFTDIRLRVTAVLKRKNPHAFRPDLFDEEVTPSKELLERLAEAEGLIRILYSSEVPLKDSRHLQFLPHMADTVSDLCDGLAVLDRETLEIQTSEEWKQKLSSSVKVDRPDLHVRVVWKQMEEGWTAQTLGLRKIGRDEWQTEPQEKDMEVLAMGIVMNAAHKVFRDPHDEGPFEMESFGGRFHLHLLPERIEGRQLVRLTREVSAS